MSYYYYYYYYCYYDDKVLSSDNQMPSHEHGSNIDRSMGLHDYQNPTKEQITNRSEEVTMSVVKTESAEILGHSETNENANELTYNDSEQRASNEEQLKNTAKETSGRGYNHDAETLGGDSQVFSLSLANSLGVDNKGFDCSNKESTFCSPHQVTVTNVDEGNMNYVLSKLPEKNHDVAVSEPVTNKKPSVAMVSCDLESALPATTGHKTVRAWLKDPHLYKVISLSPSQPDIRLY